MPYILHGQHSACCIVEKSWQNQFLRMAFTLEYLPLFWAFIKSKS